MIIPSNEIIKKFKETHGAMSVVEGIALYNLSLNAPEGDYLELGTHKGKSTIMIADAMRKSSNLILVEPEFSNYEWQAEVIDRVGGVLSEQGLSVIPDYSTNIIRQYKGLAFCFVDSGSHQDGLPMREVKMLEDRIAKGGVVAFHDFKSQFIEVEEAYWYLVDTGKYEEININWDELIKYAEENNLEDGTNNTWHHTELKHPCFLGAVRRK